MNREHKNQSPKRTVTRIYLAMIVILLASLTNACNLVTIYGSGNIVTKNVDIRDFDRVVFSGSGELMLSQEDEEMVAVAADDNLIKHIYIELREGTLYIWHRQPISPSRPILVRVSVKEITELGLSGIVNADVGELHAERLAVDLSGVITLNMKEFQAEKLVMNLSGTNKFELTGTGEVAEQEIIMSGTNNYNAPKLQSQTTSISISGSNDVTVWAVDSMTVTISGNGSVQYYGSPQINQSGSGNVELIGLGK